MRKWREEKDETSCWNKAIETEIMFITLGRDAATPDTIRFWCKRRIELGKNTADDAQIKEALECAKQMEAEFDFIYLVTHPTDEKKTGTEP